jgi:alpha-amylase/alpha-mannosidase (GH57 family)
MLRRAAALLFLIGLNLGVWAQPAASPEAPGAAPEPIMVAFLWHQHQPRYLRDPETLEYAQPWVRLHCVKDYYDMVSTLQGYPDVHVTFNLTPVLLSQIQNLVDAYAAGEPTDAYVRHTLLDAADLTDEQKAFILRNFFSLNWDQMLDRHPRYVELRDKRIGTSDAEIAQTIAAYTVQDFRDLQMLFNLAWMDPDFWEGVTLPDGAVINVGPWITQGRDFTEEDKRALIDMQFKIMAQIVPIHREFQSRSQIEISTTPYYHPILPLILDTDIAREASPNIALPRLRFRNPEHAALQVRFAADDYAEKFGRLARGVWPAEGAVAQQILPLFSEAGFTWFATDVQILARSLGVADPPAHQRFTMWRCQSATPEDRDVRPGEVFRPSRIAAIFRDTGLSDRIGFTYHSWNGADAARDFVAILHTVREAVSREVGPGHEDPRALSQHVIPIILDGENCWESYPNDGKEFLHTLYRLLGSDPLLRTVTMSECLEHSGELPEIEHLAAGSWINANFETWIGEPEENRAWDLLAAANAAMASAEFRDQQEEARAREQLLIAEGSDWFWWYGSDQSIAGETSFDEAFRGTLKQAYLLMHIAPPAELDEPIMQGAGAATVETRGAAMAPGQ